MKLTFYLFNDSVTEFEQAIRQTKLEGNDAFLEIGLKIELPFETKAYFQHNHQTKPKWLDYLIDYIDINEEEIVNTTNSFLLLIRTRGRIFAITQGFGFVAIDRSKLERSFGLRVVLNEIDPEKIKSVDARKIDTTTKQKRVFLNRNSPLYDFDVDTDEDLLNLISGYPIDTTLAKKFAGSDSLSFTGEVEFLDLGRKCEALLESFEKENYKENFGFIDYLKVIKDGDLKGELDGLLVSALENRQRENIMLAYPEVVDHNQIHRFKLTYDRHSGYIEEVTLEDVYRFFDEYNFDEIEPSKLSLIGLDQDDHAVTKKYSLDEYLVYETRKDGNRYLFSLSQWFELADDYVAEVEQSVNTIEVIQEIDFLPSMRRGQREDEYNIQVADASLAIVKLDKENFRLEGYSQVEVCDLLTSNSKFICVKKYNGSSTLSHLFSQGYVSSTLLNDYPQYREFILSRCPVGYGPLAFDRGSVDKSNITYVFAIASDSQGTLMELLPFFSKVNLRQACRSIKRMGYNVKLFKINYQ